MKSTLTKSPGLKFDEDPHLKTQLALAALSSDDIESRMDGINTLEEILSTCLAYLWTNERLKTILEYLKTLVSEPEFSVRVLQFITKLVEVNANQTDEESPLEQVFNLLVPDILISLSLKASKQPVHDLLKLYTQTTTQLETLLPLMIQHGIESNDWKIRKESIDLLVYLLDRDAGKVDFQQLVTVLVTRLRDVSDVVVTSAIEGLKHIKVLMGEEEFQMVVQNLSRISKQVLKQHSSKLLDVPSRRSSVLEDSKRSKEEISTPSLRASTYSIEKSEEQKPLFLLDPPENALHIQPVVVEKPFFLVETQEPIVEPKLEEKVEQVVEQVVDEQSAFEKSILEMPIPKRPFFIKEQKEELTCGYIPQDIVTSLKDKDWKVRTFAMDNLYEISKKVAGETILTHFSSLLTFLKDLLQDDHFKVTITALLILTELISRLQSRCVGFIPDIVQLLLAKYGDNKIVIRQSCTKIFLKLMGLASPQAVLNHLPFEHDNTRVKEETLNLILTSLLNYPENIPELSFLIKHVIRGLNDSKAKVRYVAVEACALLASHIGAAHILMVLEQNGVQDELMDLLKIRFEDSNLPQLNQDGLIEHIISRSATATPHHLPRLSSETDVFRSLSRAPSSRKVSQPPPAELISQFSQEKLEFSMTRSRSFSENALEKMTEEVERPKETVSQNRMKPPRRRTLPPKVEEKPQEPIVQKPPKSKWNEAYIRQVITDIKENEEWTVITEQLEAIKPELGNPLFVHVSHDLTISVLSAVSNLRSSVAKVAIQCFQTMFQVMAKAIESDLDFIVNALMKKIGEGNAFIIDEVDKTLEIICETCTANKVLISLIGNAENKNSAIRSRVSTWTDRTLGKMNSKLISKILTRDSERVLSALACLVQDGSSETRQTAKHAISILASHPDFEKALRTLSGKKGDQLLEIAQNYKPPTVAGKSPVKKRASKTVIEKAKPKENLQDCVELMGSDDWSTRCDGIKQLGDAIKSKPVHDRGQIQTLFDAFIERCRDGNSKVTVLAMDTLQEIIPLFGSGMDASLPSLIQVVSNQLVASHPQIRNAAGRVIDVLIDTAEISSVVQNLTTIANFGTNIKVKSALIDKLVLATPRAYELKPIIVTKHIVPCCVRMLNEAKTDIKASNTRLLKTLHSVMGTELIEFLRNSHGSKVIQVLSVITE